MSTIKRPIKKAQDGVVKQKTKKTSAMKDYVNKYKDKGGLSDPKNVANDTIAGNSPRNQWYDAGFGGGGGKQIKDLQKAFDKKYKGKLDIPENKNGGAVKKKMQTGGSIGAQAVKEDKRQQKRLSRIKETNPERAAKVENRMVKRADRALGVRGAASRLRVGNRAKKK